MLSLVCLVMTVNYMDRANLAVAAPVFQKELGVNAAVMGLIFSAFSWSYTACIPFAGIILDRIGPRPMFTVGVISWSTAAIFIGLANSVMTLLGARLAVGVIKAPAIATFVV